MQEKNRDFSLFKMRILQYLDKKGITKYECYKNTGITNGILSQKNGLSEENTMKFLAYYTDISTDWFFTGKGEMLISQRYSDKPLFSSAGEENVRYGKIKGNRRIVSSCREALPEDPEGEVLLQSIKKMADAADRNSASISKMVETADNMTKILEKLIACLIEKDPAIIEAFDLLKQIKGKKPDK